MTSINTESLLSALRFRYACKKFDPARKIDASLWHTLEQAMILSPSSYGLQPWKFVVITSDAVKAKLPAISWNQTQPRDCSHMVVFAARKGISPADVEKYVERIIEVRKAPAQALDEYKGMMLGTITKTPPEQLDQWCARQCYIALGFLLSAAAMMGIDACPMEGIVADEYDKVLGLEALGYHATVAAALGYRAGDDWLAPMPKVRFNANELVIRV